MKNKYISNGKLRDFTAPLNIKYIDLNTDPNGLTEVTLNELRSLDIDGVVIKNFLKKEEAATVVEQLMALPENNYEKLTTSKTFPASYANLEPGSTTFHNDLDAYYLLAKKFADSFTKTYYVNVIEKFAAIFSQLNGGNEARVASTPNGGSYIPATFRMVVPTKNHIQIHCGNQFVNVFPDFYKQLLSVADVWNQLSFFTVLQQPEVGGELSVFNATWDVAKKFAVNPDAIILENGVALHPDNPEELFRQKFNLEVGDLIVFSAGQLWHRVEEVYGSKMRITLGGFIGFSKPDDAIYFWS